MVTLDFCKSLLYLVYTQGIARFSYLPLHSLLQPSCGGKKYEPTLGSHTQLVKRRASVGYLVNTGVFLDATL